MVEIQIPPTWPLYRITEENPKDLTRHTLCFLMAWKRRVNFCLLTLDMIVYLTQKSMSEWMTCHVDSTEGPHPAVRQDLIVESGSAKINQLHTIPIYCCSNTSAQNYFNQAIGIAVGSGQPKACDSSRSVANCKKTSGRQTPKEAPRRTKVGLSCPFAIIEKTRYALLICKLAGHSLLGFCKDVAPWFPSLSRRRSDIPHPKVTATNSSQVTTRMGGSILL